MIRANQKPFGIPRASGDASESMLLTIESLEGKAILRCYFPKCFNIRHKFQKVEIEPDSPTFHLNKVAYQVFNKQDTEEEMEKEMATHSSVLAWRIPGTEEPGGLPSMGLHRVRHD